MQIKLNKKQNILTISEKINRKEYVVNVLLAGLPAKSVKTLASELAKLKGDVIIVPGQKGFEDTESVPEYMALVGKMLKDYEKVLVMHGGTYGVEEMQIFAFGRGAQFVKLVFKDMSVALVLVQDSTTELKTESIPEELIDADLLIADVKHAPLLVGLEYPVFVFLGDSNIFTQSTGIEQVEVKESISIRSVDKGMTSRTIYILE